MSQSLLQIYDARIAEGGLKSDPAQRAVLAKLESLRQAIEAAPAPRKGLFSSLFSRATPAPAARGVYLWGGVGRGKSMMMDLFVEALAIAEKRRVHFHAFMQEVHRGMHAARKAGIEDPIGPVAESIIKGTRLLAFDEMQITDITDAMIVGRLFEKLFAAGVVVVTTSNRPPEDLYKNGLNRQLFLPFIAMLNAQLDVIAIDSPNDYRQDRLSGAQVYFHPAGASRGAIEAIWQDLTKGAHIAPLELVVNGRVITLPAFARGIGRASFFDLCGRPNGPGDFLAIAAACRVLILEDIPQLSAANYNEAKRFVTLIDALYEAKVKLIASAADTPERLYTEGTGAFEFERTASRLREMQDQAWGREA